MSAVLFRVVSFSRSFHLPGHEEAFPPGTYRVLIEERAIDGTGFTARLRVSTQLLVPGGGADRRESARFVTCDDDLTLALARDRDEVRQ